MANPQPQVTSGAMLALRLFDVAYSIDLQRVEALWAQRRQGTPQRSRLRTPAKAIAYDVPPVNLALAPLKLEVGAALEAAVTARLYDFGAVVLELRIDGSGLGWLAFTARLNEFDRVAHVAPWASLLDDLCKVLHPAFVRPSRTTLQEDYLIAAVHAWDEPLSALEAEARVDLVPVLSGESKKLSDAARRDLLRHRFSFYQDDLAVITWDRAFIYEPAGDSDVIDVLEVANAQLLELRYYDELLDDELPRMYDLVEATRGLWPALAPGRFASLARRLYTLVAEVTELREKVDNALQVTEDVYLARIYAGALDLFRVDDVGAAVDRKLGIIRDTYAALYDEASGSRAELLELTIIALILVEIALALFRN